jgi:hypothetical protein
MPGVKNRRLFEDPLDRSSCGLTRHKAKFPRRSGYRGPNPLEAPGSYFTGKESGFEVKLSVKLDKVVQVV